jgi:hypothetical protein
MRRHLAALALLSAALVAPATANAQAVITEGSVFGIANNNNFKALLEADGYNRFTSTGASMTLLTLSEIDFYYLASESGYNNSFQSGALNFIETDGNSWAAPLFLGTVLLPGGPVVPGSATAQFDGPGLQAVLGQAGFGIFLKSDWVSGSTAVNEFIIGYDDQVGQPDDDNHDDLMILARVRSVPEPGTWAMLLLGFGALGAAMRRKNKDVRVRAAIA